MRLKSSNKASLKFLGAMVVLTFLLLALNSFNLNKKDKYADTPDYEQTTPLNFVQLTFNEKDYVKLKKKRNKALSIGILETSDSDYVPVTVSYNGEPYKAEARLKGDWTDHLKGEKWSFRVKLKGDKTILGMRKFSLHHPSTRGYINEWLYHKAIKNEELIGLRYSFLEGSIHIKLDKSSKYITKPVGVYAIEETFDKRTIENNKRKESVILKFSEDYWWNEVKKGIEVGATSGLGYHNFIKSVDYPVRAFSESKVLQDTTMRQYFEFSKTLLKDTREGKIAVSESFDVKKLAMQNAILNLFGGTHGNSIINVRFYYNPITSRLEPIAFDGNSGQKLKQYEAFNFIKTAKKEDTIYLKELAYALNKIAKPQYLDELVKNNKQEMSGFEEVLIKEFRTGGLAINNLKHNQNIIREELKGFKAKFNLDIVEPIEQPLEDIDIPQFSIWSKNQVNYKDNETNFKGQKTFTLTRNNTLKSAFSVANNIEINYGSHYETSIRIKRGVDDFFGLRIQGLYPDRVDAVFDLKKGVVKGVKKAGGFENEKANIESLGKGWYKCTLSGKINASDLRIIFGPTDKNNNILSWEAATKNLCSINIVPSSLTINELK